MSPPVILASASPRRRELLASLGISFVVVPADIHESPLPTESVQVYVRRLASEKALAISQKIREAFVLGFDTEVELDGEILGKPADPSHAMTMLRCLSARQHRVCTGVCFARNARILENFVVESHVTFKPLSDDLIRRYVATGEPLDKAGAYGAQGGGRAFIEKIEGSLTNVIGLPLDEVAALLQRHGLLRPSSASVVGG
ncbi:Maf-like protein YhdE [bacterium HR30]|nr:Maf-like protein YhdE [bacterium HR30]